MTGANLFDLRSGDAVCGNKYQTGSKNLLAIRSGAISARSACWRAMGMFRQNSWRVAAFRFFTGQRFSPNALMSAFLPRLKLGVYDHVFAHIHV